MSNMTSQEIYAEEAVSFTRAKLGEMEVHKRPNNITWDPLSAIVEYSDPIAFAMQAWAEAHPSGITSPKREEVEEAIRYAYFKQLSALRESRAFAQP